MDFSKKFPRVASLALALGLLLTTTPTFAAEEEKGLTSEQVEVIEAFNKVELSPVIKKDIHEDTSLKSSEITPFAVYSVTTQRGGALAWGKAIVDWTANSTQITSSSAYQDSGFIFPNIVRKGGITKQTSSAASYHIYLSKFTIGAGTVTPWGDVTVYESDTSDYIKVYKDGNAETY